MEEIIEKKTRTKTYKEVWSLEIFGLKFTIFEIEIKWQKKK